MDREDLRLLLLRAAATPHGLAIQTSDVRRLRVLFYPIRKLEGLHELTFRVVEAPSHNVQIERGGEGRKQANGTGLAPPDDDGDDQ